MDRRDRDTSVYENNDDVKRAIYNSDNQMITHLRQDRPSSSNTFIDGVFFKTLIENQSYYRSNLYRLSPLDDSNYFFIFKKFF